MIEPHQARIFAEELKNFRCERSRGNDGNEKKNCCRKND